MEKPCARGRKESSSYPHLQLSYTSGFGMNCAAQQSLSASQAKCSATLGCQHRHHGLPWRGNLSDKRVLLWTTLLAVVNVKQDMSNTGRKHMSRGQLFCFHPEDMGKVGFVDWCCLVSTPMFLPSVQQTNRDAHRTSAT